MTLTLLSQSAVCDMQKAWPVSLFSSHKCAVRRQKRGVSGARCAGFGAGKQKSSFEETDKRPLLRQEQHDDDGPSSSSSGVQEVPEEVNRRMLNRILVFAGVPVFTGFLSFPLFYYIKVIRGFDLPIYVVYIASAFLFGGGLLGITYGIVSASWDPRAKGSALGLEEFKTNAPDILEKLRNKG